MTRQNINCEQNTSLGRPGGMDKKARICSDEFPILESGGKIGHLPDSYSTIPVLIPHGYLGPKRRFEKIRIARKVSCHMSSHVTCLKCIQQIRVFFAY